MHTDKKTNQSELEAYSQARVKRVRPEVRIGFAFNVIGWESDRKFS